MKPRKFFFLFPQEIKLPAIKLLEYMYNKMIKSCKMLVVTEKLAFTGQNKFPGIFLLYICPRAVFYHSSAFQHAPTVLFWMLAFLACHRFSPNLQNNIFLDNTAHASLIPLITSLLKGNHWSMALWEIKPPPKLYQMPWNSLPCWPHLGLTQDCTVG